MRPSPNNPRLGIRSSGFTVAGQLILATTLSTSITACTGQVRDPGEQEDFRAIEHCSVPTNESTLDACEQPESFSHPLLAAQLVDGAVPMVDVIDSSDGKRFALVERSGQSDEAEEVSVASGVEALDRREFSQAEYEALFDGGMAPPPPPPSTDVAPAGPRMSDRLSTAVAAALANDTPELILPVTIAVVPPSMETVSHQLERAIGLGLVTSRAEQEQVRLALISDRASQVAQNLAPTILAVESAGGQIIGGTGLSHTFSADVPVGELAALASLPQVRLIDDIALEPVTDTHAAGSESLADGNLISEIHQFEQFHQANYSGENGSLADVVFAMADNEQAMEERVHFLDGSGGASRVLGAFDCLPADVPPGVPCSGPYNGIPNSHGNAVGGTIFGDLTDGQDNAVVGALDRSKRSGYAREAVGYLYDTPFDTATNGGSRGTTPSPDPQHRLSLSSL